MKRWRIRTEHGQWGRSGKGSKGSDSFAPRTPPPTHLRFLSSSRFSVFQSNLSSFPPSLLKIYWPALQCLPACLPACRNPSPGLCRSVQRRESLHAYHLFQKSIMPNPVGKEIRPTRHILWFFSNPPKTNTILFLLSRSSYKTQPPASVSFCRGKKSRTQGRSHDEEPGFSSGER